MASGIHTFMPYLNILEVRLMIIGASFASYLLFKKFEPNNSLFLVILLAFIPGLLSIHLGTHVTTTLGAAGVAFSAYFSIILLCTTLYRLSPFHPLARYPGPLLNRISKFRMVWIVSQGKQHLYHKKLHDRYGDVVRIGPNELSFCTVDAVQPLLGQNGLPKGPYWDGRGGKEAIPSLIATRDPIEHAKRRKPWIRGFRTSALKDYEEIVIASCRDLVHALAKRQGEVLDIAAWMNFFSCDTMGALVFGHDFGLMQEGGDSKGLWRILEGQLVFMAVVGQIPWAFRFLTQLPGSGATSRRILEFGRNNVQSRIQRGSTRRDLFFHLMDEDDPQPEGHPIRHVVADGILAVIAGSDTTAGTLAGLWHYLLRYPSCCVRLQAEIDTFSPALRQDPLDLSKLAHMPYLNACLNEAMRLLPPVLSGAQRSGSPGNGGAFVGSHFIPECTQALVHTYSLHRDPRYFSPFPNMFWPDRWLASPFRQYPVGSNAETDPVVLDPSAFIPFSIGPTSCAGKNLALMELRAVVCYILQQFDISVAKEFGLDSWEDSVHDFFVMKTGALPVVLGPRR